jgi:hypothetical protein
MKKLLSLTCLLMFFCGSMDAQRYNPAIITLKDGTSMECLSMYPANKDKTVKFKATHNSKTQKMKSAEIKRIRFFLKNDVVSDMDHLQVMYYPAIGKPNLGKPEWLEVHMHGYVTAYMMKMRVRRGKVEYIDYHFYCKREDEDVATNVAIVSARLFAKDPFLKVAPDYFADSPGIAERIKNKEKGYASKDIEEILREYNAEKLAR